MVHRIDGDVAFGGEGSDFDEQGSPFGFGHAAEFLAPFGVASVEFFCADEGEGSFGGGSFHGRGLVEGCIIWAEVADEGAWVANRDLDVGFEFDTCAVEGWLALLKDATHGVEVAIVEAFHERDDRIQYEAIAVAAKPVEIADSGSLVVREVALLCF